MNIWALGINEEEAEMPKNIKEILEKYKPNI